MTITTAILHAIGDISEAEDLDTYDILCALLHAFNIYLSELDVDDREQLLERVKESLPMMLKQAAEYERDRASDRGEARGKGPP